MASVANFRPKRWTDAMTRELLELLRVPKATMASDPSEAARSLLPAAELPTPDDTERRPPRTA